jgi:hypothetical protein
VATLVAWAQHGDEPIDGRGAAALAALHDALPRAEAAAPLALVAAAAYGRVPGVGPRDIHTGHAVVRLLEQLGEHGARELVRLRERTTYTHPSNALAAALARVVRRLGTPLGELEDTFGGPEVGDDLTLSVPVGPYTAVPPSARTCAASAPPGRTPPAGRCGRDPRAPGSSPTTSRCSRPSAARCRPIWATCGPGWRSR